MHVSMAKDGCGVNSQRNHCSGVPGRGRPHGDTAFCERAVHFLNPSGAGRRAVGAQEAEPAGAWRAAAPKNREQPAGALCHLFRGDGPCAGRTQGCRLPGSGSRRCGAGSTGRSVWEGQVAFAFRDRAGTLSANVSH